jgi:hypothetical protein
LRPTASVHLFIYYLFNYLFVYIYHFPTQVDMNEEVSTVVAGTGGGERRLRGRLRTVVIRSEEVLVDGQLLPAGGGGVATDKNVLLLQGCIRFLENISSFL